MTHLPVSFKKPAAKRWPTIALIKGGLAVAAVLVVTIISNSLGAQPHTAAPPASPSSIVDHSEHGQQHTPHTPTLSPTPVPAANPETTQTTLASSQPQTSLAAVASSAASATIDSDHPAAAVHGTQRRVDPKTVLGSDAHFSIGGCALGYGTAGQQCITAQNKAAIFQKSSEQPSSRITVPAVDWLHLGINKGGATCTNNDT